MLTVDLFIIILAGSTPTASFLRNGIIGMVWIGMTTSEFLFGYKEGCARYLSLKKRSSENQNLFSFQTTFYMIPQYETLKQLPHFRFNIVGAHKSFADKEGMYAVAAHKIDIRFASDAAFGNDGFTCQRRQ